jgi:hypothetical protein
MATVGFQSMKVNRAITGATTVNANCYAVVSYTCTSLGATSNGVSATTTAQMYFGPGQTIPATFTANNYYFAGALTATYSLYSGVEFINS